MKRLLLILALLTWARPSFASVGFDASMTTGNGTNGGNSAEVTNATSISSTGMTVGGSATLLVVTLAFGNGSSSVPTSITVTWNSVSMTQAGSAGSGGGDLYSSVFYLISPASGNHTIAASWTNSNDCYMSAVSFTGTDTSIGIQAADTTSATDTTSITITSASGDATVATFSGNGGEATTNFTRFWHDDPFSNGGAGNYTLGGTSNVHTFTGGGAINAIVGIHILAAGGGCTPSKVVFTAQPSDANVGASLGTVDVSVEDSGSIRCDADTSTVTITNNAGCTGMTLGGTASGSAGNVTPGLFRTTNLTENAAGTCTLHAVDGALTAADSNSFTISAPVVGTSGLFLLGVSRK